MRKSSRIRGEMARGNTFHGPPHITLYVLRSAVYACPAIKTFRCKETERLYRERVSGGRFRSFADVAYRKLFQLAHAAELRDLQLVPGNRLEKLGGDRKGQYSIRINDQWRICFIWNEGAAYDVEITDYH